MPAVVMVYVIHFNSDEIQGKTNTNKSHVNVLDVIPSPAGSDKVVKDIYLCYVVNYVWDVIPGNVTGNFNS